MLRSIGAARGAVFVAAGAENVRPPRLPELLDERASTETTVKTSAAATAKSASNGRRVFMCILAWAQRPGSVSSVVYRNATTPREGAQHNAAGRFPSFSTFLTVFDLLPQCGIEL